MGKQRPILTVLIFTVLLLLAAFYIWATSTKTIWSFSYFGEDDFLYMPSDIEVDHTSSLIYIADSGNNRILVFDFDGKFQKVIGREGQGPAEFSRPSGLFVFKDGGLAVADHYNKRIQIFDKSGEFVKMISPKSVDVADLIFKDDKVYTIPAYGFSGYSPDVRSKKETQPLVNVLDQEGNVVQSISVEDFPESQAFLRAIKHRICLTLTKDGKLFLPHYAMNIIQVFDLNGKKITEFDRSLPFKPKAPQLVQQSQDKDGIIRMQATMDMITQDAEIGPDSNLYLLTYTESYMKRSKQEDRDNLPSMGRKIDVINTKTYKVIRSFDVDGGARCFGLLDKNRLVYAYEDSEGELFLKCVEF
ncbi:MAG: 6-bladed beta-propeller [Candidatus Aminicenantes bacterium]|nr:MAG: 6-bladed beta-propeller [Candidatus Aminicenantes bacterium]